MSGIFIRIIFLSQNSLFNFQYSTVIQLHFFLVALLIIIESEDHSKAEPEHEQADDNHQHDHRQIEAHCKCNLSQYHLLASIRLTKWGFVTEILKYCAGATLAVAPAVRQHPAAPAADCAVGEVAERKRGRRGQCFGRRI